MRMVCRIRVYVQCMHIIRIICDGLPHTHTHIYYMAHTSHFTIAHIPYPLSPRYAILHAHRHRQTTVILQCGSHF